MAGNVFVTFSILVEASTTSKKSLLTLTLIFPSNALITLEAEIERLLRLNVLYIVCCGWGISYPYDKGSDGDSQAVDAKEHNNHDPNPEQFRVTAFFAVTVTSWKKHIHKVFSQLYCMHWKWSKCPWTSKLQHLLGVFTCYNYLNAHFTFHLLIRRREYDLALTSVESLAAVVEDEPEQFVFCVLRQQQPVRWRTVECFVFMVACNVRNHFLGLDKVKCHLVCGHIWARHIHWFSVDISQVLWKTKVTLIQGAISY